MKLAVPLALAAILLLSAAAVRGQSALDGFDPNANGAIQVVVVQPDGKILIGGDFTRLMPNGGGTVTRNHIARLNPDGTLDTAFNPNANNTVRAIVVQPDGKILIGGDFTLFGTLPRIIRKHIARLDGATGVPDSFDPNADAPVRAIGLQADGKVLAGGDFITLQPNGAASATMRNHIARVNPDGTLDTGFNPRANNIVRAIVVQSASILAGGDFTSIGGQPRNRIARLDGLRGLAESFNPNATGQVDAIAVQADGRVLAGGVFTNIGGATRDNVARLDATTGLADSFSPKADGAVLAIAVQADGSILVGGSFTNIGGATRNHIARLDDTTGFADSFNPNASSNVSSIAVQQDGKILAGGAFNGVSSIDGQTRNFIARLEIDGRLDQTLNLGNALDEVFATAVQTDGKILIGGLFSIFGTTHILRLNTDGTLDGTFTGNNDLNGDVFAIAVQADGKILAGGNFTSFGGALTSRKHIARLNSDGTLDMSFDPNANGDVDAIAVQADGKILVGGVFTNIGGATRNSIARLFATGPSTGMADDSFNFSGVILPPNSSVQSIAVEENLNILIGGFFTNVLGQRHIARLSPDGRFFDVLFKPNPSAQVNSIAVQADHQILVGGVFTNIGGATRNHIARLDATTGSADTFNPNATHSGITLVQVLSIALQADHKILVGGVFTNIGGAARNNIARLNATGPLTGTADSFNPNVNLPEDINNGKVRSVALQADGKILAGGLFTSVGGQSRNGFARLSNDTAALQDLAVTQNSITLASGGSSPRFSRVTFELNNTVNFTPLGDGTAVGNNWILTGLNLATGRNFIIRARGHYPTGEGNGSESVTGTRRSAFFSGCELPTSISANFNGTPINGGSSIWFNSVLKPSGLGSSPVTFRFTQQTISSASFSVQVPDAIVTFDPAATSATTSFTGGMWVTRAPSSGLAGNTFLSAASFPVPANIPGGLKNVTWSGTITPDTSGVNLQWQWAAAVYTSLSPDDDALGVKPVDDNHASQYQNSDHAGTPENFRSSVVGGATGGGGSNYTGGYSGTVRVGPCP